MAFSSILLRCIARAAVKRVADLLTFGVAGELLLDIWQGWGAERSAAQRRAEVERLASASPGEVRLASRQLIDELGARLSGEQRRQLADWLTQTPAVLRRSLRRPEDPSGRTVPAGLNLRGPDDLAELLPSRLPRFKAGDRPLAGVDLELEELLGMGGFGEVWKARNPRMSSAAPVALKFCLDGRAQERLLKHEVAMLDSVMSKARHPGIVQLRHTYLSANPPCLEYEYVEGGDLAALVQELHQGGRATPERINRLLLALVGIAAFAHRQGIVHRDLKPANVLVQSRGNSVVLRVTDFGIGGVVAEQVRRETLGTAKALTMLRGAYSPMYASPQQKRGEPADPRDDVYSLGVIWYQMLTGNLNATAPTGDAWKERLHRQGMSKDALALLVRCLEERAEDRLGSAAELEQALVEQGGPKHTPEKGSPPRVRDGARKAWRGDPAGAPPNADPSQARRRKGLVVGAVGAGIGILLLIVLALILTTGQRPGHDSTGIETGAGGTSEKSAKGKAVARAPDRLATLHPVEGTARLDDGRPLPRFSTLPLLIHFVPRDWSPPDSLSINGKVDSSGRYTMETNGKNGVPSGTYSVEVRADHGSILVPAPLRKSVVVVPSRGDGCYDLIFTEER